MFGEYVLIFQFNQTNGNKVNCLVLKNKTAGSVSAAMSST